jgi:VWFA-related protein
VIPRRLLVIAAIAAAGSAALAQAPAPAASPQLQTFRVVTSVVSVDVVVLRGREPVSGLTSDDFVLTDNGVRQKIESASSEALPIDVSLAVDMSSSVIANVKAFKAEVKRFAKMLRPNDRIRVVAFGTSVEEVVPMRPAGDQLNLDGLESGGATSLNDALFYTLLWPPGGQRRHLVIALTDGIDTVSTMGASDVVAAAARVEAVVHAVLVTPAAEPSVPWQRRSLDATRELALATGGSVHPFQKAAHDFKQVVDDFRAGYVLKYVPEKVPSDGVHELSVTLGRKDANRYVVRARKTYFGG